MKKNEIIERFSIPEFIVATKEQLQREFSLVDLALQIKATSVSKDEILDELTSEVALLLRDNPERMAQLFYRMDLPESKTSEIISHAENIPYSLAELMLIRCAQKVYLRSIFK